jgi:hypothetical protein
MPYTFMHPIYAAPLKQRWPGIFDLSALMMGSIAPDVDIIYRFTNTRHHIFDYSLWNILTLILPIAVCMTVFMKLVMIPVYTTGTISRSRQAFSVLLRKMPSILFSAFIAIILHLMLDNITHIDDIVVKAKYHAENLGREPEDYHDFYYLMMYGPTLLVSGIGLLMGLWYAWWYRTRLLTLTSYIRSTLRKWSLIFLLILVSFTLLKHITVGVEDQMRLDSYAISITCGLLSALLLSPVFFYLRYSLLGKWLERFQDIPNTWYLTLMPISGFYLIGIPNTERLREFVLKGIFLLFMSAAILLVREIGSKRKFYHSLFHCLVIGLLTLGYVAGIKISPAWWWVKVILAIQGLVTFIYLFSSIFFPEHLTTRLLRWFSGGFMLFVLAYYLSDKGFGPGIIVVALSGWLFSMRNDLSEGKMAVPPIYLILISLFESVLMLVLFISLKNPAGLMLLLGLILIYLRRWGIDTFTWVKKFNIAYYWWLPISGIIFMGSRYSISYGLLSLSAFFIFFPFVLSLIWDAYRKGNDDKNPIHGAL